MRRTTITLTDDLAELIDHEARRRHQSVSRVIRDLIRQGLTGSTQAPRLIPWAGIFEDPDMVPSARIEEELEKYWGDDLDRDR